MNKLNTTAPASNHEAAAPKSTFSLSKGTRKVAYVMFQLAGLAALSLCLAFFLTLIVAVAQGNTYEEQVHAGTYTLASSSLLILSMLLYILIPEDSNTEEKQHTASTSNQEHKAAHMRN